MSDETTTDRLAEIDREMEDIERAVAALQQQANQANYPQQVETTTDRLAEIEGQMEAQPVQVREGWWAMRGGRHIRVQAMSGEDFDSIAYGYTWRGIECKDLQWNDRGVHLIDSGAKSRWDLVKYLGPIDSKPEPEQTIDGQIAEIEEHAAEPEPQPVQVREGRWRTRGGEIRNVTPTPADDSRAITYSWHDARCDQTWLSSGRYHTSHTESPLDLREYLGPIQPEPEQTITTDDVGGLVGQQLIRGLVLQVAEAIANEEATEQPQPPPEQQPEPQPAHQQAMIDSQAETIARLNSEVHNRNMEIANLQQQLQTVKAELVRQCENSRRLQIDLDAREQVPQAVSDRFEEGWDAGTARAVESIAEWTEPFRQMIEKADNLVESDRASRLCAEIMQSLPAIMRSLTGLTPED